MEKPIIGRIYFDKTANFYLQGELVKISNGGECIVKDKYGEARVHISDFWHYFEEVGGTSKKPTEMEYDRLLEDKLTRIGAKNDF